MDSNKSFNAGTFDLNHVPGCCSKFTVKRISAGWADIFIWKRDSTESHKTFVAKLTSSRAFTDFSDDDVPIPVPTIDEAEGEVPKAPPPPQRLSRRAPELPQIERRNYLLHQHFVQGDIDACKALIKVNRSYKKSFNINSHRLFAKGTTRRDARSVRIRLLYKGAVAASGRKDPGILGYVPALHTVKLIQSTLH